MGRASVTPSLHEASSMIAATVKPSPSLGRKTDQTDRVLGGYTVWQRQKLALKKTMGAETL